MPVIASDSTYGRKKISRKIARPGNLRFRRTARESENGIWRVSESTTMKRLLPTPP